MGGPFMVWANLKQNFGLLNFILESCVPYSFTEKQLQYYKPEYGLKIWNSNLCLKLPGWEYRTTFSGILFLLEVFHWNDPRDVILFHLFSNWILRNIFVNCKLPLTLGLFYSSYRPFPFSFIVAFSFYYFLL